MRTDDHDVGGLLEEAQCEQLIEERAVKLLGPVVVEVGHGLEGAEPGVIQPALKAAALPLAFLDLEQASKPGLAGEILGVGEQAVEVQPP
jgi:hypothetical protein